MQPDPQPDEVARLPLDELIRAARRPCAMLACLRTTSRQSAAARYARTALSRTCTAMVAHEVETFRWNAGWQRGEAMPDPLPPDDDPAFHEWLRRAGPQQSLPAASPEPSWFTVIFYCCCAALTISGTMFLVGELLAGVPVGLALGAQIGVCLGLVLAAGRAAEPVMAWLNGGRDVPR